MIGQLIERVRGGISRMMSRTQDGLQSAGKPTAMTGDMARAIERWRNEYTGHAHWLRENDQSLGLPAMIAAEMATLVTLEAKVSVSGSARADYLMEQLRPVLEALQVNVEYACAVGGIVMKPSPDGNGIAVDYIHAWDFVPMAFNSRMEITKAAFVHRLKDGDRLYKRVETHEIGDGGYTIANACYACLNDSDAGRPVPLSAVPEWAEIEPVVTIANVDFPLFAYFRIPLGNTVDPKSPLGVSVYAKAEKNIREADLQYQRMLWEFEGGELAIDASEDMFKLSKQNEPILPAGKERLYRTNELSPNAGSDAVFSVFSPTLRDASLINGLNEILAKIEDQTGLARGTLSDRIRDTRTATEIKFSRQKTYATVTAIQTSLGNALEALIRAIDALATLYQLAPSGSYEVSCIWDDSVVTDADTERTRDMQEVRDGLMQKWEYRAKWYGEDEQTARRMTDTAEESDDQIMGFDDA